MSTPTPNDPHDGIRPPEEIAEADTQDQQELLGLLFETNPYGNLDAIVQHDGRVVYFYLNDIRGQAEGGPFGTRACWVRNIQTGPYVLNPQDLERGIPPLMPRTHCRHIEGQPIPEAESLHIVWFEEGNGAALYENDQLLAVIPPWSGVDDFHGYSAQCVAENQLAWPLPQNAELHSRIQRAQEFWVACGREDGHPFSQLQPELMNLWRKTEGLESQYFSIDGGQFPPCGAALFSQSKRSVFASIGMSFRPQPNVELLVEHPQPIRRIELAMELDLDADEPSREPDSPTTDRWQPLLEQFSGLVSYPWKSFSWFGHGHSCQLSALSDLLGPDYQSAAFVADAALHPDSKMSMPTFRGDPIQLLWLVPLTQDQEDDLNQGKIRLEQILANKSH